MDSISEKVLRYISDQSKNQALLLSGPWGMGKTYYIKKTLQKVLGNEELYKNYKTIYVSLYGVASLVDLQRLLGSKFIAEGFIKKDFLSKGKYGLSIIGDKLKNININVGGIGLNIGISDIINLENLIDYENVILLFDDLERCSSISLQDIFGFINRFTEHKNIPVIVTANEANLRTIEQYDSIKEKSIYREIAFSINLLDTYSEIVDTFNFEKVIKDFLISQFEIYINRYEALNLRDLKFFLNNWNNLFHDLKKYLDSTKDYYFLILEELCNYLFLRSIQYKHGKKNRVPWNLSSQYGNILKDETAEPSTPLYLQSVMGFKFIDDYVYGFALNKEDIKQGLDEVIAKYEDTYLALFGLRAYNKFSEKEVLFLLGKLLDEIINHEYSQINIRDILIILVQIRYSCKINFDIEFYVECLAELIINDEGALSYNLKAASYDIDGEIKNEYAYFSSKLIETIKEKEADIDKKELDLNDKFNNPNITSESIKEFVIKNKERYAKQLSILRFIGDTDLICKMIKEFDNQRLLALYDVLQWLYWYTPKKECIDNDKEALKQLICYIANELSILNCDKVRRQNLGRLRKLLEGIIND